MKTLATLALTIALATPAWADDAQPPLPAETLQLATQVVQAIGITQVANAAVGGLRIILVQTLAQRNHMAEDRVSAVVDQVLMPDLQAREPGFIAIVADDYGRAFTPDELQQILAFYQTPVGQKLQSATPALTQKMVLSGRAWVEQAGVAVLQADEAKLKAQGLSIQ
jgi:hypothetical protein